jgi:hypothetical protein
MKLSMPSLILSSKGSGLLQSAKIIHSTNFPATINC